MSAFSDEESEREVLKCALSPHGERILTQLRPEFFFEEKNQVILATARKLHDDGAPVGNLTVIQALRDNGDLERAGGKDCLSGFSECAGVYAGLHYLDRLRGFATTRGTYQVGQTIVKRMEAGGDPLAAIADAISSLNSLSGAFGEKIVAHPLSSLPEGYTPDAELIRDRFLCRGGGALLVGPSGIGKSTLTMQLALAWAIGRPQFGMVPARPLRSLIVQAENDTDDMREMRDGCLAGMQLHGQDAALATAEVLTYPADAHTGTAFLVEILEPLIRAHKPQLVWIDPAFSYIGGDSNSAQEVGAFLRNGLNPILHRYNCAAVVVHHTNKPSRGKEKGEYQAGDFAYLGAGSAEWTNWARAVLAIQSLGTHDVFKMHAAKRGSRLSWKDENGDYTRAKHIAHAREHGLQYWREADPDEVPDGGGRPEKCPGTELLKVFDGRALSHKELCAELKGTISPATMDRRLKELKSAGKLTKASDGKWVEL